MSYDCRGRKAKTVNEAECAIQRFLYDCRHERTWRALDRSHDYDLYLPWLIEILENQPHDESLDTPASDLERLFMEAAWSLAIQGYLRPGPRKISSENAKDGFGKGYSLTFKGEEWLQEASARFCAQALVNQAQMR